MNSASKLALMSLLSGACLTPRHGPAAPSGTSTGSGGGAVLLEDEPAPVPEEESLEQRREKLRAEQQRELQRFTPELRAQSKALTERNYPDARATLEAVIQSPHRKPSSVARDPYRHPLETLQFFDFEPDLSILEFHPSDGWYTELLAPALAKRGKLLAASADPNGPAEDSATFEAQRLKALIETSSEVYGKVAVLRISPLRPALPGGTKVDMVLLLNGMHDLVSAGTVGGWLKAFHGALARRGVLGIEQHRAPADADPRQSAQRGYLPEAWVIARVEAAGFKLVDSSEVNANSRDTKDYPAGVWTLPPTYRLGEQDREKYAAIGESDRMTLKFVKVEEKPPMSPFVP